MMSQEESIKRIEKVFNSASDNFDNPALSFWNVFGEKTINRLSLNKGDRVLDVCCGTGASAIPAAISVGLEGQVLGIDIAESLLKLARKKSEKQGLKNIEFQYGDFETLGFPDESFDAIVCVFGIFFVPDMLNAVRELWRMVRPGGKLAITSWGKKVFEPANQMFWRSIESERPDLYKQFTPWDRINDSISLQRLLEEGGVTQIDVFAENGTHKLNSPEDWWTMVLGGGLRGTIDQLDPLVSDRIREDNIQFLKINEIMYLDVEVLYAMGRK